MAVRIVEIGIELVAMREEVPVVKLEGAMEGTEKFIIKFLGIAIV
jgi:hypothetical protein